MQSQHDPEHECLTSDAKRLEKIKKRCNEATPGKWILDRHPLAVSSGFPQVLTQNGEGIIAELRYGSQRNAAFIAHAREDIPFLLAEIKAKDAALERAAGALEELEWSDPGLHSHCPLCGGAYPRHVPACKLQKTLAEINSVLPK